LESQATSDAHAALKSATKAHLCSTKKPAFRLCNFEIKKSGGIAQKMRTTYKRKGGEAFVIIVPS
jgi:hypothetical protein